MATPQEPDFPPGHPARFDYDPASPEAREWARVNIHPKGERDWPIGHPKAVDTEGNMNAVPLRAGIDPNRPDHEEFTGRSPAQAKAAREVYRVMAQQSKETPALMPTIGMDPPSATNKRRAMPALDGNGALILCPGCKVMHQFDSRWQFNGSYELPSFMPSMCVDKDDPKTCCHSYVTNGRIQFLPDSAHALKGQTVELPAVDQITETINA